MDLAVKSQLIRFCLLLSLLSGIDSVAAQDPGPINTERPSFSSSPFALPVGYWQIEAGYQLTRNGGAESLRDHTLPNALLRFGLLEKFELQLNWSGYTWKKSGGTESNGFQDASIGLKWQLGDSNSSVPIGLFASVSLPIGDQAFSSDDYDPKIGVFWSHSGSLDWFGTATVLDSGDNYQIDNAVGFNFSLAERQGVYLEYHGSYPEGQGPAHNLNSGMTWLVSNDLQLDVNGGVGLNKRASDFFVGVGISYRF